MTEDISLFSVDKDITQYDNFNNAISEDTFSERTPIHINRVKPSNAFPMPNTITNPSFQGSNKDDVNSFSTKYNVNSKEKEKYSFDESVPSNFNSNRMLRICCCIICFALILILALFIISARDGGFAISGISDNEPVDDLTQSPTNPLLPTVKPTLEPTDKPTPKPTTGPTPPTKSPSKSPTKSPSHSPTKFPTTSPTSSPSQNPTNSPTTTIDFIEIVCSQTSQQQRTSVCLDETSWIRCEKDGSLKPLGNQIIRKCEQGDVCPCDPKVRVSSSDPCVLEADSDSSRATCSEDLFTLN